MGINERMAQYTIMGLTKKSGRLAPAFKLFLLCFFAYMFSYFGRYDLSACQNAMINEGILDLASASMVASAYFICYGAGQLINGAAAVRISPKYMIGCGLLGVGVANILMGICPSRLGLVIIWGANGLFNSMLWSPIVRTFSEWLDGPTRERAGANISLTIPFGTLGSYVLSSMALKFGSWRMVFYLSGAIILVYGIIWLICIGALPEYRQSMNKFFCTSAVAGSDKKDKHRGLTPAIFFGTGLTLVAVSIIFNGALKEAVIQYIPQLMINNFGISDSTASLISTCVPFVGIVGPYVAIALDKKLLHNECYTAAALYGVSLVSMLAISLGGLGSAVATIIFLALSTAAMWGVNTIMLTYISYHYGHMGISSAVSGTLNCFVYVGSALCANGYGKTIELLGWNKTIWIWCAVSALAVAASVAAGIVWGKKQPKSDTAASA